MAFSMGKKIHIIIRRKKMTITDLATANDTFRQNLMNKLNLDNFLEKELQQIAEALGCRFKVFYF